jgi:hypothetical protein
MMDDPIKVKVEDNGGVKVKVNEPGVRAYEEPIEEFDGVDFDRTARNVGGGVANLVGQVGRLYFNVLTLPLNLLPSRSRYHAKNSIREGFLSFKVLVDDVTGAIDDGLTRSLRRDRLRIDDLDDDTIRPARNAVDDTLGGGAI